MVDPWDCWPPPLPVADNPNGEIHAQSLSPLNRTRRAAAEPRQASGTPAMHLLSLTENLLIDVRREPAAPLAGLTDDSRRVRPGGLFIARPAAPDDPAAPLKYLPQAIAAGASAVLLPGVGQDVINTLDLPPTLGLAVMQPPAGLDQRLVGTLAERFHGHPSAKLKLIGITGTNGKTTTATIVQHLLNANQIKCGLIGTVTLDTGDPDGPTPATLTTPGAAELSALFAQMVANGCQAAVMEVSSHALHQGRADALTFAAAGFTNLTQDHLDYHGNMEAYADAKALLFESLGEDAVAVVNMDDRASSRMTRGCKAKIVHTAVLSMGSHAPSGEAGDTYGFAEPVEMSSSFSAVEFKGPWGYFNATLPMPGRHNLSNAVQATALSHAVGLDASQLRSGLESSRSVPGRLEPVGPDWPQTTAPDALLPAVLVDYAHTPDALINVGSAMRELTTGKLITVFGCGGDRDRAKRPLMAQAAQQYADVVVLTSDNPRTEDPWQILDDAEKGFGCGPDDDQETYTIADRAEAIRFAIGYAGPNDTVLIAGKGHEDYQILGTTKHHFDDREQAAAALRARLEQ